MKNFKSSAFHIKIYKKDIYKHFKSGKSCEYKLRILVKPDKVGKVRKSFKNYEETFEDHFLINKFIYQETKDLRKLFYVSFRFNLIYSMYVK